MVENLKKIEKIINSELASKVQQSVIKNEELTVEINVNDLVEVVQFLKSNDKKPNNADTLNYLGFTTRKLGDFENGEKYYLQGLAIEPNHIGINEYLGELYVVTNRMDLAKERLQILKGCNCEEYSELKEIIEGTKKSKY